MSFFVFLLSGVRSCIKEAEPSGVMPLFIFPFTSAPAMMIGHIGNMLILNDNDRQKAHLAEHRIASGPPNGMGDLAAALMVGNLLTSKDPVDALQKTSASLYEVMAIAAREQTDELPLEASIGSIIRPHTSVLARTLLPLKT